MDGGRGLRTLWVQRGLEEVAGSPSHCRWSDGGPGEGGCAGGPVGSVPFTQVTARKRARPQAGRRRDGEPSRSQNWGGEGGGRHPQSPGSASPESPAREQRAAGRSRGCWDACAVPGPSPSPAPYPRLLCPPPAGFVRRREDGPVVCGGSAGGVRLHPDRRPGRDHKD